LYFKIHCLYSINTNFRTKKKLIQIWEKQSKPVHNLRQHENTINGLSDNTVCQFILTTRAFRAFTFWRLSIDLEEKI